MLRRINMQPTADINFKQNYLSIDYALSLINKKSITPDDGGCQQWLSNKLTALGFTCQQFNINGVTNTIACIGEGEKSIAFAGHTDVVCPGNMQLWDSPPFNASIAQGELIGRGAADMKTGLAAMLAATEKVVLSGKKINTKFFWLLTSDEEGEAEYGSQWIQAYLEQNNIKLNACIVGEPSSKATTGDAIKVGRRGSLSCKVSVFGKQGHVAYPYYADNAIHKMNNILTKLTAIDWDTGSEDFPGTSLQVTHVDSGNFTDNLVPDKCTISFNIRYSAKWSQQRLIEFIDALLTSVTSRYSFSYDRPCEPYLTTNIEQGCLIQSVEQAIFTQTGKFPLLSTSGGTSDGRFFSENGTQVVEIGVPNKTIHQVNERIKLADLALLEDIYTSLLTDILV